MQYFFLILALLLSAFFVIFSLQNADFVTIDFIITQVYSSLALVLVSTLILGIFIGLLVSSFSLIKQRLKITKQSKKLKELQKMIDSPQAEKTVDPIVSPKNEQTTPS